MDMADETVKTAPAEQEPQATVTNDGIRVALAAQGMGADEWIEFKKDFSWADRVDWDKAMDVDRMRLIVTWSNNWRVFDKNGALIPFEKEALLADIGSLNIPFAKMRLFVRAMYRAFGEAYSLPL